MTKVSIPVDQSKANVTLRELKLRGHVSGGQISPFDIPRRLDASYDVANRIFKCELIYLTSESTEPKEVAGHGDSVVIFYFGKNSGKLYSIEIRNVDIDEMPQVSLEIRSGLDKCIEDQQFVSSDGEFERVPQMLNLLSARKVMAEQGMFSSLSIR